MDIVYRCILPCYKGGKHKEAERKPVQANEDREQAFTSQELHAARVEYLTGKCRVVLNVRKE